MDAIHIVGAGGIGCAVGHALAQAGAPVTFVERSPDKLAWCNQHGVRVNRRPAVMVSAISFDDWHPQPGSIVLLCVKCHDNPDVLARLPEHVHLIPIQNGFDPNLESRPPLVEGVVTFVSRCRSARTHTHITRRGRLYLGINGTPSDRLRELASTLAGWFRHAPFGVSLVEDIRPIKYGRLVYDAALCPIAALGGLTKGDVLIQPRARELFFELLRENHAILTEKDVKVAQVNLLPTVTVMRLLAHPWLARSFSWLFAWSLRGSYCPLSDDLHTGRSEIDYYNGHFVRQVSAASCPVNRVVLALIGRMIGRHLPPHADRLNELWAAIRATSNGSVILPPIKPIAS